MANQQPIIAKNENLFSSLGKEFKQELQLVVAQVLIKNGVKAGSDLINSVEFDDSKSRDSLFMYVNEYYEALSEGRKPKLRKIPLPAIIRWIKKYNITSYSGYTPNQLAFAIQNSIYKNGIRGRNFIEQVNGSVSDVVELQVADYLEEAIADSLLTTFTIK